MRPSGHSVRSKTLGMQPSENGRAAGRPSRASMKACSRYATLSVYALDSQTERKHVMVCTT